MNSYLRKWRVWQQILISVGIGLVIGPIVAYGFNVFLYILGKVSYFALKQWKESLMVGWCISIPAGALIGGLSLNYRTSLAVGVLCGLLFAYSLFGFLFWQSRGILPYYPDLLWMVIAALQGVVMALLIRLAISKINKDLAVYHPPYEPLVNWLAIGTSVVLFLLWGIGRYVYIASQPSKEVQAKFIAVKFQPNPVPKGKEVKFYAWVDSKESIKSVYLVDSLHNVYMLRLFPQASKNNLLFFGELIPQKTGFQKFVVVMVTPSGSIKQEVFLHVQP